MSDELIAEIHERLNGGRSTQATAERVFLRGFNAGIEFAIKQVRLSCDEVVPDISRETEAAE